jgi:hypothetical protein
MFATPASGLHQTGALQRLLHPGATQVDVVFAAQFLVKVSHVKIKVLLLVQAQHLLFSVVCASVKECRGDDQTSVLLHARNVSSNAASAGN